MKLPSRLLKATRNVWQTLDPYSLQMRLTVGIAAVSAMGLGGVAIWTSWKMQHILVTSQKQNIQYLAERLPHDIEIYSDMLPLATGMQKAINNLTTDNTLLWVRSTDGSIIAQSTALQANANHLLRSQMQLMPKLYKVRGRYWVACGNPLQVKGKMLGKVYVAKDITSEQIMFLSLIRTLGIASGLSIVLITVAIAIYIQRALQPLRRISQLTQTISVEDLGQAQIQLDRAPTEVKELAQTFNKMLLRLFDAWEMQRQFVSNFSHELRTPLTIVSGYLQSTLRRGANLTQPQKEALEIAVSETDRTIQLLQDLLELARADNGRMRFNVEPLILNEVVAELVEMAMQYSNRAIALKAAADRIEVKADRDRLKQVLLNLIDNAVKYSDPDRPVTLKLEPAGEQVKIHVCDEGSGIPLSQQTRIFERFYRVDENRARSTGGTGLGLSIVKTLVEGMGGHVTVRSQPGKGSVFTVSLPLVTIPQR
ncbi:MAG TPA: two-component sensor histidine kinase [Cyanobacteria bacterium UBA8803]|nr:two-component sensor histidine kinase [Cyanobacteria bacterium UBA9273]HBL60574.1 two-component sensor histidine kinase [Cyanobacteria bacterium UBA8803]